MSQFITQEEKEFMKANPNMTITQLCEKFPHINRTYLAKYSLQVCGRKTNRTHNMHRNPKTIPDHIKDDLGFNDFIKRDERLII